MKLPYGHPAGLTGCSPRSDGQLSAQVRQKSLFLIQAQLGRDQGTALSLASTTRMASESPLIIRLRMGKFILSGPVSRGKLGNNATLGEHLSVQLIMCRRITDIHTAAKNPVGICPALNAPRWAAPSIPSASPLIICTCSFARSSAKVSRKLDSIF